MKWRSVLLLAAIASHALAAEPIRISGTLVAGGIAFAPIISRDGTRVVFTADKEIRDTHELYTVPLTGGSEPVKISGALIAGGNVQGSIVTHDSKRVVFSAIKEHAGVVELYSAPLAGGAAPVRISHDLAPGESISTFQDWSITADDSRVFFATAKNNSQITDVYSAAIAASGNSVKVAGNVAPISMRLTGDGTRAILISDGELYSVPIGGSPLTKLSGTLVAGGSVTSARVSPDGSTVVFTAVGELYRVSTSGNGAPVKIPNVPGVPYSVQFSPDGSQIVFLVEKSGTLIRELYSVAVVGSEPLRISNALSAANDTVDVFLVLGDSATVVFRERNAGVRGVYSASISGGSIPRDLSGPLTAGGAVFSFSVNADNTRVVFVADKERDDVLELYSVLVTGATAPTKLSGKLVAGGIVAPGFVTITPDGRRVVFIANKDKVDSRELYSVAVDGSGPIRKHSGSLVAGGGVGLAVISPDGERVVFQADKNQPNVEELFETALSLALDIDGDGTIDSLTDGILFLRWHFGLRGAALIANAIGANATRTTAAEIEAYMARLDAQPSP